MKNKETIYLQVRVSKGITYIYESISKVNNHHVFSRRNDIEEKCLDENNYNKELIKEIYVDLLPVSNLNEKQRKEFKDSIRFI